MNIDKAAHICQTVEDCHNEDGLSTVGLAMIHLCQFCGVSKDQMLEAMSRQWDLYEKQKAEHAARTMN